MARRPAATPRELMMPVTDADAVHLVEIEAPRQITDNLKRLNDRHDKLGELIARQTEMLHGMDRRLIRIESKEIDHSVKELQGRVEALEADKNRREGAFGLLAWTIRNWPGVVGFFLLVFVVLQATGRLG